MGNLERADHVGEVSDIAGMGGNIVQGLDQGASIFGHGGGVRGGGFMPGSELNWGPGSVFNESRLVNGGFNGLGALTSGVSMYQGGNDALDSNKSTADRVAGVGNLVSGGLGVAGGMAGVGQALNMGMGGFTAGLANVGGAAGVGGDVLAASTWGAGAAGGAAGVAGTALATAGAVIGAGTAGYGIGRYGDQNMENLGWMGKDGSGKNRSISDAIFDASVGVDDTVSEYLGGTAGGIAGGVTNVVGSGVVGVPMAIASTLAGLGNWIMN